MNYPPIRSALRPAAGEPVPSLSVRMLHEQYDRLFKSIVSGGWSNESSGNVEAPCGYFALIIINHDEAEEVWNAHADEDTLTEGQLKWLWSGVLAGYYVTTEDSNGIIRVYAYDSLDEAQAAFNGLEKQFQIWDDADEDSV